MRTNIDIDDELLRQAMAITGKTTKKETVEEALRRLVDRRRQADLIEEMAGKFPDWGDDYKTLR